MSVGGASTAEGRVGPRPFRLDVPDEVLDDLRARLDRVRWPDEAPGAGWSRGTELATLMTDVLGHRRLAAQGGDWGAYMVTRLALDRPDLLCGIHLNLLAMAGVPDPAAPTAQETRYLEEVRHWQREERGYFSIQGTKPQTLAYGLTDSPVGLLAWIVEKFRTWTDRGGGDEPPLPRTCSSPM